MVPIVTLTFSPCIDKSTSVPELVAERKLHCAAPKLEPGGGGINVARAIVHLGGSAIAVFPSGGYTGKYFNHLLDTHHVPSVVIESKSETRENIIVFDEATRRQYRFGMPGTPLSEREWKACLQAVENIEAIGYLVVSGSLPPGVPLDVYAQLSGITQAKHTRLIVDTSGEGLIHAANAGVYLMKPNLNELGTLAGMDRVDAKNAATVAKDVLHRYRCEVLVVSLGMHGAIAVTKDENHYVTPPKVVTVSTVGAGDSMVAGIIWMLARGENLKRALQYGVACGTAATIRPGTALCAREDADRLFGMMG